MITRQQKEEKLKEVRECNEELKQIRESKEIARQSYGVDPDSQEQKDLELLEKYQDYQKGVQTDDFSKEEIDRLKELQNTPLTDYQTRALQLNAQRDVILNKKDRAQRNVTSLTEAAADAKLDQLKSQDMQKAQDAADELLDASDKDAFGMLIQDAVDHIDEKQEEEKEKAEATPELELPPTEKPVCPICHKGSILRGKTAYGCSEYKNGCTFRLDYATYGNNLTDMELNAVISKLKP